MADFTDKTRGYSESDAGSSNPTGRPLPTSGIGQRIGEVASLLGSRTSAYTVMNVSSAALQRYIKGENVPPIDAVARLCVAAGVRLDWLATGNGPMKASEPAVELGSQPARLDRSMLREALEVLDRALANADVTTDAAGRAELVVAIYELLEQGTALDAAQRVVATMLRAAARTSGASAKQG